MTRRIVKRRKTREYRSLDRFLWFDFTLLIIFTIINIILFCVYQQIPETLVQCFFTCFGAENGFMALIVIVKKITEEKHETDEEINIS